MNTLADHYTNAAFASRSDRSYQSRAAKGVTATTALWLLLGFDAVILLIPGLLILAGNPFYNLDTAFAPEFENSVPAWYASMKLLLFASLLAALSVSVATNRRQRRAMLGAALLFLVMSCDEAAGLHERLQQALDNKLLRQTVQSFDSEILSKVLVGLAGLAIATFAIAIVVRAFQGIENGRIACAAGFLALAAGAVGVDLVQEFLPPHDGATSIWSIVEEGLELVGVTLMIFGALRALACAPLTLHLGPRLAVERGPLPASGAPRAAPPRSPPPCQ